MVIRKEHYIRGSTYSLLFFLFVVFLAFFFDVTHVLLVTAPALFDEGFTHEVSPEALYQYFLPDTLSKVSCHTTLLPTEAELLLRLS